MKFSVLFLVVISPKFFISSKKLLNFFSSILNLISIFLFESKFLIKLFIFNTSLILFSIFIHPEINLFKFVFLKFFSKFFPLSKVNFILLGNFSISLIILSLINISLNFSSTSKSNLSSLSFIEFLIFVNTF